MSKTFDQGKEEVVKLCRHFTTNRQAFLAPGIKEAHIRQMLIDPFFEALGWDVRSAAMVAPQYRSDFLGPVDLPNSWVSARLARPSHWTTRLMV